MSYAQLGYLPARHRSQAATFFQPLFRVDVGENVAITDDRSLALRCDAADQVPIRCLGVALLHRTPMYCDPKQVALLPSPSALFNTIIITTTTTTQIAHATRNQQT